MKITYYLYNTFIIQSGNKKIAIDPGALFFYFFRLTTLIPKSEWKSLTHIFVTHGDLDHYWHMDRVAKASNASVICNKTMVRNIEGKILMLAPRAKGLAFSTPIEKLHTISVGETIYLDGMSITGIKTTHGPLTFKLGPFSKTLEPGPDERIGWGTIGFNIRLDGKSVVNLGDTLLHEKEWQGINRPDVLIIPIGGRTFKNTMDENEAIEAVKIIQPKLVIPCHYSFPALFFKKFNNADDKKFKKEVEKMGIKCVILQRGNTIEI